MIIKELETDLMLTPNKIIGMGFMIFGMIWSILDRSLCRFLCKPCTDWQTSPCFLLFLFAGIIFVVVGFSLTKIPPIQLPKIKFKKKII